MQSEPLTYEISRGSNGSTRVVRLVGPLVLQNIFELKEELCKEPVSTIFDLSAVPYMDSAGLGVIMNHYVSAARCGHKVIVAGTNPRVLELFKVTRVDAIIAMAPSVEEAEKLG